MSYATGSGTLRNMVNSLAAFLVADGWDGVTPGAHRYWSILGYAQASSTGIANIDFFVGPTNVNSDLASVSASGGVAADAFGSPGWSYTAQAESRWTIEFTNAQAIDRIELDPIGYRFFTVEYSDDGVNWKTARGFVPNELGPPPSPFIVEWDVLAFPLRPNAGDTVIDLFIDPFFSQSQRDEATNGLSTVTGTALWIMSGESSVVPLGLTLTGSISRCISEDVIEWHFFSDPALSNYFHVAFRVEFQGRSWWFHLSGGDIDKLGMTHHGVVYCSCQEMPPFASDDDNQGTDRNTHNSIEQSGYLMGGQRVGFSSSVQYRFNASGGAGFAVLDDGQFPARANNHKRGLQLMSTLLPSMNARFEDNQFSYDEDNQVAAAVGGTGWATEQHPTTGFVTLGNIPFIVASGDSTEAAADFISLGEYPGVKGIRIDNLAEGDEIAVGADTWQVFPLHRKTALANSLGQVRVPLSGPVGIAYKKVL